MKNVIDILEKQYNSFINEERDWNFFLGLADYADFVLKTSVFKKAIDNLKKDKSAEIDIVNIAEEEAVAELQEIKKGILVDIKKKKLNPKGLSEALLKLKKYEKGEIDPDCYKSERIERGLRVLDQALCEDKEESDTGKHRLISNLSNKLTIRRGKSVGFHDKKQTELWGAYEKILLVHSMVHSNKQYDNDWSVKHIENEILAKEMRIIKNDGSEMSFSIGGIGFSQEKFSSSTDRRINEFKRNNYKLYVTRVHNYLLQELSLKDEQEAPADDTTKKLAYKNGILYFQNKEINFTNKANQRDLLNIIFEEPKKNWSYDEIQGEWDGMSESKLIKYPKDYWKKFNTAGDNINTAIARKTMIEDFIVKNTKEIRINPKYI